MREINAAWEVLRSPARRAEYDTRLRGDTPVWEQRGARAKRTVPVSPRVADLQPRSSRPDAPPSRGYAHRADRRVGGDRPRRRPRVRGVGDHVFVDRRIATSNVQTGTPFAEGHLCRAGLCFGSHHTGRGGLQLGRRDAHRAGDRSGPPVPDEPRVLRPPGRGDSGSASMTAGPRPPCLSCGDRARRRS